MKSFSLPKSYNTYFLAFISTIGGMLFGFDISSMSAIVITPQYVWYFDDPHGVAQGAIGSALAAGSIVGALMAGPLSDKFGRRDSIAFSCIFWLIGTAVQVSANSRGSLIAGRVINGITVGITSSQVPVYLAEIAKKDKRGSIIVIQQLAIEFGILIMYFVGYGCSFIGSDQSTASFRTAWGIQFVPAVFLLMGLPFLPRSPRWLAKVGRTQEAVRILAKIQAGGNVEDPLVVAEWEEITTTLAAERQAPKGWRKFTANGMWKRTFAGASVQAWQQLSGANVMTYYITYIFAMAGLHGNINLISSGIQYALFIIFSVATFFFIDRTGRRPLLIYGAIGMGVCHFVIGGVLGSYGTPYPDGVDGNSNVTITVTGAPSHTVIAFCYLLIIVYALTLAPVAWVYAAEVWSLETRAYGMSLASIANWLFNFALGLFVPPALQNISWKTFIVFGVLCFAAALQAFVSYPETARKSLEEIEEMFRPGGPHPWNTKVGESNLDASVRELREGKREASVEVVREELRRVVGGGEKERDEVVVGKEKV
ncbi:MFS sugar transporter-like protein [Aulographum hederae CBS 113979]|uniref:MFS sugar transporter-like protein n=1 Tax=Aulographum hederae CBS 113979 TaxID=1176131 RepID=A0A6G1H8A2_9PEZI|nr:MFS sugar transporter-like protein [Aulographum hederae CBS 113979]